MVELSVLAATPRRRGAKGDDGWGKKGEVGWRGHGGTLGKSIESRWPSTVGSGILWQSTGMV